MPIRFGAQEATRGVNELSHAVTYATHSLPRRVFAVEWVGKGLCDHRADNPVDSP